MLMTIRPARLHRSRRPTGIALITAVIMLLVITLLALGGARLALDTKRSTRNQRDFEIALVQRLPLENVHNRPDGGKLIVLRTVKLEFHDRRCLANCFDNIRVSKQDDEKKPRFSFKYTQDLRTPPRLSPQSGEGVIFAAFHPPLIEGRDGVGFA